MYTSRAYIGPPLFSRNPIYAGRRNKPERCKTYGKVDHVIFDLDGAVLDNHKILDCAYARVFEKYGQEYTPEWGVRLMGMTGKAIWEKVVHDLDIKSTWQKMYEDYNRAVEGCLSHAPLIPGVERLVEHLEKHNIPMAVVTSSSREAMEAKTGHIRNLMSKFKHVVCGEGDPHVQKSKPFCEIYQICALRFLGKPEGQTCLVIEDSFNGIMAAKGACMQVVGIPCSSTTAWTLRDADEVVDTLNDFWPGKYGMPPFPGQVALNEDRVN